MNIPLLSQAPIEQLKNKTALVRVDFNVPVQNGKVSDDKRIRAVLPTIELLAKNQIKVILMSHRGRPKGNHEPQFSMQVVYETLKNLSNYPTYFCPSLEEKELKKHVDQLPHGALLLLENLRFHPGEKQQDETFGKTLASLADFYINDAFGTLHRKDTSVYVVPRFFKEKYAGLLVEKELQHADYLLHGNVGQPFTLIMGGAKVSDKVPILRRFLEKASIVLIGGAMAMTFVKALGGETGKSLVEEDQIETALTIIKEAQARETALLIPEDFVVASSIESTDTEVVSVTEIPKDKMALDIGPKTVEEYRKMILRSKTLLWNGPMGVFEREVFAKGTFAIAEAVAQATQQGAFSLVGGGDSAAAIQKARLENQVSFVSTGGGALLTYLSGEPLPGLQALQS